LNIPKEKHSQKPEPPLATVVFIMSDKSMKRYRKS